MKSTAASEHVIVSLVVRIRDSVDSQGFLALKESKKEKQKFHSESKHFVKSVENNQLKRELIMRGS